HAKTLRHAGTEAFDGDVGDLGEPAAGFEAGRRFEIDREATLVAVDAQENGADTVLERRPVAGVVAGSNRLDLDHFDAEVGQVLRAQRPRQDLRKIDDADALQRRKGIHRADPPLARRDVVWSYHRALTVRRVHTTMGWSGAPLALAGG